ncbi:hypothetical protein LTR15_002034 [Elasticomyces elasticus]|nr:hypothetical protein LTR15_002034 [Elasticomyces elasticus]
MLTAARPPSRLLALPKELRLIIYDMLFEPMTIRPDSFEIYVLFTEWPKVNTSIISKVAQICKQVNIEAKAHFETNFLSKIMLYFDNMLELIQLDSKLSQASEKYRAITVTLYTSPRSWLRSVSLATRNELAGKLWQGARKAVDDQVESFIRAQPGLHISCAEVGRANPLAGLCSGGRVVCSGSHDRRWTGMYDNAIHNAIAEHRQGRKPFDTLQVPVDHSDTSVSVQQICGNMDTRYVKMTATIERLDFCGLLDDKWGGNVLYHFELASHELQECLKLPGVALDVDSVRKAFAAFEEAVPIRYAGLY